MRVVILVLLSLMVAGCGSKDGGSGFETPEKDGEFYVIHLTADGRFDPEKAQVPKGSLVSFQFERGCDVVSDEAGGPDTRGTKYANGAYPAGETYNWQAPDEEAEFHLACTQRTGMVGVLKVG